MKKRAMSNPAYLKGEIIANKRMGSLYHRLRIALPQPIGPITPGQFAMLSIAHGGGMVLPRPFSIHNFEQGERGSWLDFLFKIVGRGTAQLANLSIGSPIMILAPMGKGFPDLPSGYQAIIIAGGMGIAPLFPLIVSLQAAHVSLSVLYGAKSHDDLVCLPALRDVGDIGINITTEDGTGEGEKGFVTQLLKHEKEKGEATTAIYACGPEPMLQSVSDYADERNIRCWISIERWMACGVGACLSCVVHTTAGYKRVCCDGPIFDATDIAWRNDVGP
jgi:dihydroorotate dehydrogenase electron transfer subunit